LSAPEREETSFEVEELLLTVLVEVGGRLEELAEEDVLGLLLLILPVLLKLALLLEG